MTLYMLLLLAAILWLVLMVVRPSVRSDWKGAVVVGTLVVLSVMIARQGLPTLALATACAVVFWLFAMGIGHLERAED